MYDAIITKLNNNSILLERELSRFFDYEDPDYSKIIEAQKYGLLGGGKRIRAFLVMELCRLFGGDEKHALPYACAIEMIHASSLIHDDMPCMDNDDFRRGKPSTHKAFGESLALLAGDSLMVKAFETAIRNPHLTIESNAKVIDILSASTGDSGMLGGQTMDISAASHKLDLESLMRLHSMKTGKLISASAKLGCIAADVGEADERYCSSEKYAESVGLAFQIIDDVLDYREGKSELNSFLAHMSEDEAISMANKLTIEGIDAIKPYDDGTLEELATYLITRNY